MPNLQLELILELPDKLEVSKHGEQTALASVFCMVVCGALKYLHGNDAEQIGIITCLSLNMYKQQCRGVSYPLYFQLFVWFWHDYVFADVCGLKICDSSVIITMRK